jgi:DNA-binding CsgD family transcriptional regulator
MPIQRPLTPRQDVILRSVARGKTNKDIAAQLGISEQGVKVHISRLLERYGAQNRVELVTITKAWPDADGNRYSELSGDIAGIRAGLNKTYQDATDFGETHSGNGHVVAPALPAKTNGHSTNGHLPKVELDLAAEVRSPREVLGEINVALKLARELPANADVGPLVDAIRTRVGAALEQSARLDALVDGERNRDRRSRQSAS